MMWTTTFTKHITYAKILILKKQNINPNLSEIIESNISNNSISMEVYIRLDNSQVSLILVTLIKKQT